MRERLTRPRTRVWLRYGFWALGFFLLSSACGRKHPHALVFQTDFGTRDGAVAAMKGVAFGVSSDLPIFDLTHEIPPFDVWRAAYRLRQAAAYWPEGTVFVSVVDPGVGTRRKSVVLKTDSGHYFVSPDNGTLTLVADDLGIAEVREIDERRHRRPGSEASYTFHGRDIYALTGAKLAAGRITFEEVGQKLPREVVRLPYAKARFEHGAVYGTVEILDEPFGNVWTNITREVFGRLGVAIGQKVRVRIEHAGRVVFHRVVPFVHTFGDVPVGEPLLYFNSLERVALAINQGDLARTFGVAAGGDWSVQIFRVQ